MPRSWPSVGGIDDGLDLLPGSLRITHGHGGSFGVPESKMRIICTKVGGGFGGKIEPRLEPITIALGAEERQAGENRHDQHRGIYRLRRVDAGDW